MPTASGIFYREYGNVGVCGSTLLNNSNDMTMFKGIVALALIAVFTVPAFASADTVVVSNTNSSTIVNVVSSSASTGGNTSNGGNITTGDATAVAVVKNFCRRSCNVFNYVRVRSHR